MSIERSSTSSASGLFQRLVVGGSKPDGPFVVALRENGPDELDATVVSLGEEPRMCSLGPAISYGTSWVIGLGDDEVDDRSARILTVEGGTGDTSGTLHVFDASCDEVLQAPAIELPTLERPVLWTYTEGGKLEAFTALTVDGSLLRIDPWAPSIRSLGEHVSRYWRMSQEVYWLVEEGALVLRDAQGNTLASVGSGVTEVAMAPSGTELAFVDEGGLSAMTLAELSPTPIVTGSAPCKPKYLWSSPPTLAYLEDCAVGNLALLDRSTGEKQVFSSAVTDVGSVFTADSAWVFFLREPPAGKRELWAIPAGSDPVLVGFDPDPALYKVRDGGEHGFFVLLDHDGDTGTLGAWTPDGGFEPLLEGVGWPYANNGYLTAVAEREGDIGALVALQLDTLDTALRVEDVPWRTVWSSFQAPAFGYIRGWDSALGAGTFEVWVQPTGQQITVDEGVSELRELTWPKPGVVYAVRTPGREGLWTAYADW